MAGKAKIFSLNVNGLRDNVKRKRLKTLLHSISPEVVLLQETHIKQSNNTILKDRAFPLQWHSNRTSKARGTAILMHRSVQFQEEAVLRDREGRFIAVKGILHGEKVTIASFYAPNSAQISFLDGLFKKLTEFGDGLLILGGDCNYISDLKYDRSYAPGAAALLRDSSFTTLHKLGDIWTTGFMEASPPSCQRLYFLFGETQSLHKDRCDTSLTGPRRGGVGSRNRCADTLRPLLDHM